MILPDPVPIGVAGNVTVPRATYLSRVTDDAAQESLLLTDEARVGYLAGRLADAFARPLTSPGSEALAGLVFGRFRGLDLLSSLAEKALETLRDGESHNRTAISPADPRAAIVFVAWNGTHREVQSERLGNYLGPLFATGRRLVEHGLELEGVLEVDAYVRDNPDPSRPGEPLHDLFHVDVEYSYLPGFMLGSKIGATGSLPKVVLWNPDLCTQEERQALAKLAAATR